jgi:hypothetical protein
MVPRDLGEEELRALERGLVQPGALQSRPRLELTVDEMLRLEALDRAMQLALTCMTDKDSAVRVTNALIVDQARLFYEFLSGGR